jgi:acetolactate synthase-1/2/3 large subunit
MAWGPPAAITAKLLNPDKPVVSVSGDGGFAMAAHVLSTAVQYKLSIIFVVMNNSLLGMIYDGQEGKPVATEFSDTDFSTIAQGFGARGVRIRKPEEMTPAIKEALRADLPTVIDVITDQTESHAKITSEGAY